MASIEFSPNDYFSSTNFNYNLTCNKSAPINCTTINLDNSSNCVDQALCMNYELANGIAKSDSYVGESTERYNDAYIIYNKTAMNTINISAGIVGLAVFIYLYY
jgi:hypothetical protein